jgi:cobalt-zinc-cadmium efflux system protein
MSKSDKDHNHSNQNQPKKNIKIAFFINLIFSAQHFFMAFRLLTNTFMNYAG